MGYHRNTPVDWIIFAAQCFQMMIEICSLCKDVEGTWVKTPSIFMRYVIARRKQVLTFCPCLYLYANRKQKMRARIGTGKSWVAHTGVSPSWSRALRTIATAVSLSIRVAIFSQNKLWNCSDVLNVPTRRGPLRDGNLSTNHFFDDSAFSRKRTHAQPWFWKWTAALPFSFPSGSTGFASQQRRFPSLHCHLMCFGGIGYSFFPCFLSKICHERSLHQPSLPSRTTFPPALLASNFFHWRNRLLNRNPDYFSQSMHWNIW